MRAAELESLVLYPRRPILGTRRAYGPFRRHKQPVEGLESLWWDVPVGSSVAHFAFAFAFALHCSATSLFAMEQQSVSEMSLLVVGISAPPHIRLDRRGRGQP